jgi:glucuronoarabinoxylan endo-1,4-beta-xylanase
MSRLCFFTAIVLFLFVPNAFCQSVKVNWNQVHQKITGFGGSGGNSSAENFLKLRDSDKVKLCDLLFSTDKGIGISMVRNEIYWTLEPSPGVWDWIKDDAQIWLMNEAKKRGVNYFWSAAWSMPAWMKDNNDIKNGGHLLPAHYQDYAEYLAKYVKEYKTRFNIGLKAISLQNEPDVSINYQSCVWNSTQFLNFIKNNLGPVFAEQGINSKIVFPEPSSFKMIGKYADSAMNDPEARKYINIISAHQYDQPYRPQNGSFPRDTLEETYAPAKTYGKELWESEISFIEGKPDYGIQLGLGAALLIHNAMVKAQVNAYSWWAFLNSWGDNEGLADLTGNTFKVSKRLYAFGNFSKFVRPGYVMIGITERPEKNVYCTAFKDPATGKFAIIMINKNAGPVNIPVALAGLKANSVVPWVTSEDKDLEKQPLLHTNAIKNGFFAKLKGYSITTFTGKQIAHAK